MMNRTTLSALLAAVLLGTLASAAASDNAPGSRPVSIDAKAVVLSDIVDMLFKDSGFSYTLDPSIAQLKITAVLKDVPWDAALRQLVKAAGVVFRVEGGTYIISPRPREIVGSPLNTQRNVPADAVGERIVLNFVEPADVVQAVAGQADVQVLATGSTFIVLRGSQGAIDNAKKTLRLLDTPDAYPRAIRVKLTLRVTTTAQKDAQPKQSEVSTESVGIEGSRMPLQIDAQKQGAGTIVLVSQLTPSITNIPTPNDSLKQAVSLTGNGSISGTTLPVGFSKQFDFAITVSPGAKAIIAAGSADMDAGKVEFEVTATASIEPTRVKRPVVKRSSHSG